MISSYPQAIRRQWGSTKLALWRSAGIVDTGRGAIVIRNCDALRALVGCF
jgi:hypothetical protein